jgi:GGDEF-like domain
MLTNRVELVVVMFAAWRVGAGLTRINPSLTAGEAPFQIEDSSARAANAHERIRGAVGALGKAFGCATAPLIIPVDKSSAWAWIPTKARVAKAKELDAATANEPTVSLAVGEPAGGIEGFRLSHDQAVSARAVALAAGGQRSPTTPFVDVAPIAMLYPDLDSARAWVHETLVDLAVDSSRNEGCARQHACSCRRVAATRRPPSSCSSIATPRSDGRRDVELALLACHWMKNAMLQTGP